MPRPVAFRPPMRDAVLQALAAGSTYRDAVATAGIPWSTWRDWCRSVREDRCTDSDVEALVRAARETYAKATASITAQVRVASAKDWRAAAFLLEHRRGNPKALHDARKARWEAEIARAKFKGTLPAEKHEIAAVARVVLMPPEDDDHGSDVVPESGPADAVPRDDG